ncbi:MAG TPA: S9 family peptidase [Trebonia sp.]|jgi:dipeptidyl aminopeptidase/acylaminoacyl peptidase|nr:S9 family peptidase [Trebonia sp.]
MPVSPEDLLALRLVGAPDLSPDGTRVVAAVQRVDDDHEAYRSQLWLVPVPGPDSPGGADPVSLTEAGPWSDTAPVFSPDGSHVAFVCAGTGPARVGVVAADGRSPATFMGAEGGAPLTAVRWLDDDRLIVIAERRPTPPPGSPVRIDWLRYKSDGARSFLEPETELWLFSLRGPAVLLARPTGRITCLAVGGGHVAYAVEPRHCDDPLPGAQVRVLDVASGADEAWWDSPAPVSGLAFTGPVRTGVPAAGVPGRLVAVGDEAPGQSADPPRVWLVERGGARIAFADADVECERMLTGDCRPQGKPRLVQPLGASGEIAFIGLAGHDVALFAGDPATGDAPRRLTPEGWSVTDFSAGAGGRLAVCLESPAGPAELYLVDAAGRDSDAGRREPRRLSAFARSWAEGIGPVAPEDVAITGPDGTELRGLLYRGGPGARPLVVRVHGGPHMAAGRSFDFETQLLAAAGYSVLAPNVGGSAGRGTAFRWRSVGQWGLADYDEVMAFTDWAVAAGAADEQRLYLTGGSYGGYLTNWTLTQTTRFRAAISERSVSSLVAKFGTSDNGFTVNRFEFGGADIFDDSIKVLLDRSPLLHASDIQTPVLLIHGEQDYRCPIEQSEQLFVALRRLGREVVFLRFPGESHGLATGGRPDRRVARLTAILDWLSDHP